MMGVGSRVGVAVGAGVTGAGVGVGVAEGVVVASLGVAVGVAVGGAAVAVGLVITLPQPLSSKASRMMGHEREKMDDFKRIK